MKPRKAEYAGPWERVWSAGSFCNCSQAPVLSVLTSSKVQVLTFSITRDLLSIFLIHSSPEVMTDKNKVATTLSDFGVISLT